MSNKFRSVTINVKSHKKWNTAIKILTPFMKQIQLTLMDSLN